MFAEEVEPTGCVPMALSLERYRFAAVPHQFDKDPRLTPRNSPRIFQNSLILHNERLALGRKLNDMVPNSIGANDEVFKQSWKLVYRASTHGFSADAFHAQVDGLSPTFIIVLIDNVTNFERFFTLAYSMSHKSKLKMQLIIFFAGQVALWRLH